MRADIRSFTLALLFSTSLLFSCESPDPGHPWLELPADSPHRIVEYSGADGGQIVLVLDPTTSRDQALELGRTIQSQAPAGAIVNARLFDDEETARGWRTAQADMYVEHLLVVVTVNPATGLDDVRWVRPDSLDASTGPLGYTGGRSGAPEPDSAAPTGEPDGGGSATP